MPMSNLQQPILPQRSGTASWVLDLDEIKYADLPWVGGKGANLGKLIRAGLPVRPAFVSLPTHTCRSPGGLNYVRSWQN